MQNSRLNFYLKKHILNKLLKNLSQFGDITLFNREGTIGNYVNTEHKEYVSSRELLYCRNNEGKH